MTGTTWMPRPRPRVRLIRTAVALLLAALVISVGPLARPAGSAVRAADGPSFVILVDGLCTELPAGAASTATFSGEGSLPQRLVAAGWPAEKIALFGYRGGLLDTAGRWQPAPYTCSDSRDHSLRAAVDLLQEQIATMAAAHAGATFHVIGFSQGGLIAFGYLARVVSGNGSALPTGAGLASVATLDAPLGGAPFVELLCGFAPDVCGGSPVPAPDSALRDMSEIWNSGVGTPAGGTRSVGPRVAGAAAVNQAVATTAAARGVEVLTVGNVRDWMYAPAGPNAGTLTFLDSQWLTNDPRGAGVHARAISSGPAACPASAGDLAASFACNHVLVTRDPAVAAALVAVLVGASPALASSCGAGSGGCLSLPPRPATAIKSTIAAGIVIGGGKFGTSAASVESGGRATILFTLSPALGGASVEIWGRSTTGAYRYMTTRVADRHGFVRYFTPPITAWAAIQARYAGNFVNGAGVSPGRVVTIR